MSTQTINGKALAANVRSRVPEQAAAYAAHGQLGLAVVLLGDDPASEAYVRSKGRVTIEIGMKLVEHKLSADTSETDPLGLIETLNRNETIHGILVKLPLPPHLEAELVINTIDPAKDVDGFHISNVGLLGTGQKSMVPCTSLGCLLMLKDHHPSLSGLNAVVIDLSNIVGKPMAQLLLKENCTVTIARPRTKDIAEVVKRADIVVAAVGYPEMVTGDWLKPGATVADVGINRIDALEKGEGKTRLIEDCHLTATPKWRVASDR